MKASPIISSLNSGELSPTLQGRVDLAKYASGCRLLQNFLPMPQGPIRRRGGTHFVAEIKASASRAWLVRFEYSATQAWMLEFGNQTVRFFTNRGQVNVSGVVAWATTTAYEVGDLRSNGGTNYYCKTDHTSGVFATDLASGYWYALTGTIYEIPSPYATADLTNDDGTCALHIVQAGDVLYIANQKRTYAPRTLTRYGSTDWVFDTYEPDQGPFLEMNSGTTTIYASGQSGSVTLYASAGTFASTDVGRLVRLQVENQLVKPWEPGKSYNTGDLIRSDGKTYEAQTTATSGSSTPVHESGSAYDGNTGVYWEYIDAGYGIARITAFTSSTEVTATVVSDALNGLRQFPLHVTTGYPTTKWQLGAWSATTEYPAAVTFWLDRLWWAGQQRIWGSVPNDFANMAGDFYGETGFDAAVWATLQAEDVNTIQWISGAQKLMIGTPGGEFAAGEITSTDPVGPGNFKIERQSKRRCRSVQPLAIGSELVFVQRAGRRLLSMQYEIQVDAFKSDDLAILAERMMRSGIVDLAYQAEPFSIIWCLLSGGNLVGLTFDPAQQVMGWHRHPIGGSGIVESVQTIPSPDGLGDDLWLIVRRTINGSTKRYVEYMGRPWEGKDNDGTAGDDQADAFYVDSGLTYDGSPATTISGLDHLEGEAVQVLADGAVHPTRTVASGQITLADAASVVHVGLSCPARLITNDLEAGGTAGTAQGKFGRVNRVGIRFIDTLGGKIGRPADDVTEASVLDEIDFRSAGDSMDEAVPIFSGIREVTFPGDWTRERLIEYYNDQPLPVTIAAIMPKLHTNDT